VIQWRALRQPAVREPSRASDCRCRATTDPYRRPRLLQGSGLDLHPVDGAGAERVVEDSQPFVQQSTAGGEVDTERGELLLYVTGADADDRAATGEQVQRRERLC